MITPLQTPIGTAGDQNHARQTNKLRNHYQQANHRIGVVAGQRFDHLGHPEAQGIQTDEERELDRRQMPNSQVGERLCQRNLVFSSTFLMLTRKFRR